jgi:hypothetical protein
VAAPKRKRVAEQPVLEEVPKVGPRAASCWLLACWPGGQAPGCAGAAASAGAPPPTLTRAGPHLARLQWLEIKEADDEKTVSKKRKLMKAFKSKMRCAQQPQP